MRTWTLEERYRVLNDPEEIIDLYEKTKDSKYRQKYHIQPITGLLSDPNGFTYYNDRWHLFYQWCPWGAVHGLKYWYHVSSPDLVHWENEGIGLSPDTEYDNKGVHSGSAITQDNTAYLFYTGNHRDEDWIRTPYTCLATFEETIKKLKAPLFGPHSDYTEHQRDPKVIYNQENERYYILIGAQNKDLKGCILVYSSKELDKGWRFEGELEIKGVKELGGMWECPNLTTVGDKDLLIFSPQYIKLPNRNESTNHIVYLLGEMDFDNLTFIPDGPYEFLDNGFDFYAAQVAYNDGTEDPVLIGWIGLPDNHYPTEEEDWEGSLSLPRRLKIKDHHLVQWPVDELDELRIEKKKELTLSKACIVNVEALNDNDFYLDLFTHQDGTGGFKLNYLAENRVLEVSKENMEKRFNVKIGENLKIPFDRPLKEMRIYIDSNSVEIFFNQGEKTFTAHIYPSKEERYLNYSSNLSLEIWKLKASNTNEFII